MASKQRESIRGTVVKSSFTGVAATVVAALCTSPTVADAFAGSELGAKFGLEPSTASNEDSFEMVVGAVPLSEREIADIHSRLAATSASMDAAREATDARIEFIQSIADGGRNLVSAVRHAEASSYAQDPVQFAQLRLRDNT